MMETLISMTSYISMVIPGLILILLFFIFIKPESGLRIIIYIFSFVLLRDAMTPAGLWTLGKTENILWIRLSHDPIFLVLFGTFSLIIIAVLYLLDKENRKYLIWFADNKLFGILYGFTGALFIVLPFILLYKNIDINHRGGTVSTSLLVPVLIFAILGNFFEEGLFRGYVLGFLKQKQKPLTAGINSGLIFAFCHIYLAITVTGIGLPLLLFTLWEGIVCGLIGTKYGIIPSTIAHGGAIFLLSSGLF